MLVKIYNLLIILLLLNVGMAYSQQHRTEISIDFRKGSVIIEPEYSDNLAKLQAINDFLKYIKQESNIKIIDVTICGSASPEGSYQQNHQLAAGRLTALENLIRNELCIPDSLITRKESYLSWDYLRAQVQDSDLLAKDKILSIISEKEKLVDYYHTDDHVDSRLVKLKQLEGGKVWQELTKLYFEQMRNASAVFITYKNELPSVEQPLAVKELEIVEQESKATSVFALTEDISQTTYSKSRKLYFKTNALGWGLAIANGAVEIDFGKHFSFALPVYFSGWDYFVSTIKFRTFAVQPEVRYWLTEDRDGFFGGAHLGMAYYNLAAGGDYRYQDHSRRNPAYGGGLSVGYRLPISANNRWKVEFSIGAGVYSLEYDKFHNTPNSKDGMLVESVKRTYWGIDQLSVSFMYYIELNKKGGKR